ncbi:MAG: ABC transporter ATP-binding protein, partial [Candidatus Promineifilaceae bacterium]
MLVKREFRVEKEYHYNRSDPVKWIASHLMRYPALPIIALAAAIINNYATAYIQIIIGRTFDLISEPGWEISALALLALGVVIAALVQGILGLVRNYATEFIAQRMERDSRDELYISLLGKDQTFHGRQRIGDVMARATNDVRQLNYMFSPGVMLIMDSAIGTVIPIILIATIDLRLLIVPLLFLILFAITLYSYNEQLNPVSEAQREEFGKMNAGLAETVSGIGVVKGNAQEPQEEEKFDGDARSFRNYYVKQGEIQARYLPLLIFSVALAAAFLLALFMWRAGELTLGQVVTYMGLIGLLRFPTFISLFSFNLVQLGIASARRILEMINTETDLDENEAGQGASIGGEVVFDHISFGYNGSAVLKDISFTAKPGETVAIVGQTGSGKTTLTRLINRIFDVNSGRVLVDGADVRDWNLESLRSQISTIEQDVFLFSRTIAENIAFGCPDAS